MKRNDLALADLAKAVELIRSELGRSMAYALRAKIYQSEGKLDEALKDYTDAITLAPDFAYHHDNRGNIYFEKQQYQKAMLRAETIASLSPLQRKVLAVDDTENDRLSSQTTRMSGFLK